MKPVVAKVLLAGIVVAESLFLLVGRAEFGIPLIKWKLRNISETESRTVMEKRAPTAIRFRRTARRWGSTWMGQRMTKGSTPSCRLGRK
jgi:hypothetical protein